MMFFIRDWNLVVNILSDKASLHRKTPLVDAGRINPKLDLGLLPAVFPEYNKTVS